MLTPKLVWLRLPSMASQVLWKKTNPCNPLDFFQMVCSPKPLFQQKAILRSCNGYMRCFGLIFHGSVVVWGGVLGSILCNSLELSVTVSVVMYIYIDTIKRLEGKKDIWSSMFCAWLLEYFLHRLVFASMTFCESEQKVFFRTF